MKLDKELFADDTQLLGKMKEMESGLRAVKEQMSRFEERNNDDKEEELIFGTEESNKIRVLGSYLGPAIRQINNIDFSSEVSTVHKFVYTDEALLLVRQ